MVKNTRLVVKSMVLDPAVDCTAFDKSLHLGILICKLVVWSESVLLCTQPMEKVFMVH